MARTDLHGADGTQDTDLEGTPASSPWGEVPTEAEGPVPRPAGERVQCGDGIRQTPKPVFQWSECPRPCGSGHGTLRPSQAWNPTGGQCHGALCPAPRVWGSRGTDTMAAAPLWESFKGQLCGKKHVKEMRFSWGRCHVSLATNNNFILELGNKT